MTNEFIRVSNDEIINVSTIHSIKRQHVTSVNYDEWIHEYNELMQDVIKEYMLNNIDKIDNDKSEDEIANKLYEKFAPIVRRNLEKSVGKCPEPYVNVYVLRLSSGIEIGITEEIFNELSKIIKVDFSKPLENKYANELFIED